MSYIHQALDTTQGKTKGRTYTRWRSFIILIAGKNALPHYFAAQIGAREFFPSPMSSGCPVGKFVELERFFEFVLNQGVYKSAYQPAYILHDVAQSPNDLYHLKDVLDRYHLNMDLVVVGDAADSTTAAFLQEHAQVSTAFAPEYQRFVNGVPCGPYHVPLVVDKIAAPVTITLLMDLAPFQVRTTVLPPNYHDFASMPFISAYETYLAAEQHIQRVNCRSPDPYVIIRGNEELFLAFNGWGLPELFRIQPRFLARGLDDGIYPCAIAEGMIKVLNAVHP